MKTTIAWNEATPLKTPQRVVTERQRQKNTFVMLETDVLFGDGDVKKPGNFHKQALDVVKMLKEKRTSNCPGST